MKNYLNDLQLEESYDEEKAICCFVFTKVFEPRISEIEEIQEESALLLQQFLDEANLSFEDFYNHIRYYSCGHGLDFMRDFNEMNKPREEIMSESYMDF